MPAIPKFIAPAYQALLLEEAADLLSRHLEELANGHSNRAKLFDNLGAVESYSWKS